ISGNGKDGLDVVGTAGGTGIVVTGNAVGVDVAGHVGSLGNAGAGISLTGGASGDVVGGTVPSDANTVAGNIGAGIQIGASAGDVTHVSVQGNRTFANGGLGIDLAPTGVDCSTTPPGPNDYVPCPVVTAASTSSVSGTACP